MAALQTLAQHRHGTSLPSLGLSYVFYHPQGGLSTKAAAELRRAGGAFSVGDIQNLFRGPACPRGSFIPLRPSIKLNEMRYRRGQEDKQSPGKAHRADHDDPHCNDCQPQYGQFHGSFIHFYASLIASGRQCAGCRPPGGWCRTAQIPPFPGRAAWAVSYTHLMPTSSTPCSAGARPETSTRAMRPSVPPTGTKAAPSSS